ncbi:MAG: TOTE conflict system archaeo-eukaryotic primase domain-containing protein, partial [Planctomycetota bacterium]
MSRRKELLESIAKEKDRLASLEREEAETRARLEALGRELAEGESGGAHSSAAAADVPRAVPETPDEKVALFASLFRGRADVFARRWENRRTGKTGYAPACANEWVRGVCEKPRIRCGECPNQAFLPLSDGEILAHLQGRQVVGLYPLLQDESCWLLAADFDRACWKEDVLGFAETCRARNLPVAIERSRSGNGAHAWIFFTSPVPTSTARRVGCALLTETMARRHALAMGSYDRLFPNQDTLPRGGFGSLIALPLQLEARN